MVVLPLVRVASLQTFDRQWVLPFDTNRSFFWSEIEYMSSKPSHLESKY